MFYSIPEDAATAEATGHIVRSTRFMEGFQTLRPIDGGADLTPFLNAAGLIDIYSVGTGNRVFRLRQQSDTSSPWHEEDLGFAAVQLFVYAPTDTASQRDQPHIMGINADGQLTLSTFHADQGRYVQRVSQPASARKKIKWFRAAYSLTNVYANVILEDDTVATSFMSSNGSWASTDWAPVKQAAGSAENARAKIIEVCANNPVQKALFAIGLDNAVLFAESRFRSTEFTRLPPVQAIALTVAQDGENRLNIFAVDTANRLYYKREKQYSVGTIQWEDWKEIPGVASLGGKLRGVRAVIDKHGLLEVFGIGVDDLLYHAHQTLDERGKIAGWTGLFPLGNPVPNSIMGVGRNQDGYSEVYTVSHDDRLFRFWQDPDTTEWNNYEIQLENTGEMISVPIHSLELLILDEQQNARPETSVNIWTSSLASLRINGLAYVTTADTPARVKANGAGKVVIDKITTALSAPTYTVLTDFMSEGEAVEIEPNAELQDKLHGITTADVLEAKNADGTYLLRGDERTQENAEHLAAIMNRSMSLNKPAAPAGAETLRYLSVNRSRTGLRYRGRGDDRRPGRIRPEELAEQHWQVDLSGAAPRYRELTRDEATALVRHKQATLASAEAAGFLGIDWGGLWNSIKEGVGKILGAIKDFVVTTIVDPISKLVKEVKVFFTLLIEGIEYVIDKTIEFVQQAFQIVEGIWNKIKVFFKDLFDWLAFLFNWKDIVRTADVIEHSFNVMLDYTVLALEHAKSEVKAGFEFIKGKLDQSVNDFLKQLDPAQSVKSYGDSNAKPAPAMENNSGHNPLLNAIVDNGDKLSVISTRLSADAATPPFVDKLQPIIDRLKELANNFEFGDGKQAFEEAVGYFSQIGDRPDQLLNLVLSGFVKLGESIALFALDVAEGIVLSLLDLVKDMVEAIRYLLNDEWEIPIVSQLYKLITGESLTFRPLRVLSIVLAIPVTVVYKAIRKEAPFPDAASVDAVTQNFTAQWLAVQSGLLPPTEAIAASGEVPVWQKVLQWISNIGFGVTYIVRAIIEPIVVYKIKGADAKNPVGLVWQWTVPSLRLLNSVFSIPWIVQDKPYSGFSCRDMHGFGNYIWTFQALCGPTLGLMIVSWNTLMTAIGKDGAKIPPEVNEGRLTIWGCAHLGMVIVQAAAYDTRPKDDVIALNVMSCVATQMMRFCAIKKVIEATKGVSWVALAIAIVGTYIPIAVITWVEHPTEEQPAGLLLGSTPASLAG